MEEVSGGLQSNQGINVDVTRETLDLLPTQEQELHNNYHCIGLYKELVCNLIDIVSVCTCKDDY